MPTMQTIPTRELNRLVKQKILTPKSVKGIKETNNSKIGKCTTTAKVVGNHINLKAICNIKRKK